MCSLWFDNSFILPTLSLYLYIFTYTIASKANISCVLIIKDSWIELWLWSFRASGWFSLPKDIRDMLLIWWWVVLKVRFINGFPVEIGAWSGFLEIHKILICSLIGNLVVKSDKPWRIGKRKFSFLYVYNKLRKGRWEYGSIWYACIENKIFIWYGE